MDKGIKRILLTLGCSMMVLFGYGQYKDDIPDNIQNKSFDPYTLLWYTSPASRWNDALPVGNGRLGAMVFGGVDAGRIQLNEDTYWTGGPYSSVVKGGYKYLPEVQQLVFKGEWWKAQKLFGRKLMGYPVEQQKYQSLADLVLFFDHEGQYQKYHRWLDLKTGIAGIQYTANGITYNREVFASDPDQVIVVRLTADKPGSISFTANLRGVRNQDHSNYGTDYFEMNGEGNNQLVLTGKSADYLGIKGREKYEARIKAVPEGGTMTISEDTLFIKNANEVTLYFVAATNFVNYKEVSADQHARVMAYLDEFSHKSYHDIRETAIRDYQNLFGRVKLNLPLTAGSFLPTDERLKNSKKASDPALAALAYQFGRFVLITSSRPGTQAANLQGIWNEDSDPMWDSKYTTNINTEMNYWPVESANLSECAQPLIHLVEDLTDEGAKVAREHYGCRGWVFHQNTDLWRVAAPMDGPTWGTFTVGGAWLTTHLWEHFLFTRDTAYLKKIYPVIKGSVQFFMDFLVKQPGSDWLVTNPSTSPENFPERPGNKPFFDEVTGGIRPGTNICAGSSIDMQILHDLFGYYIQATEVLDTDHNFAAKVSESRKRLLPPQVGKDGMLQEWAQDWGQTEAHHRHLSPLYGLYPGNVFSSAETPRLIGPCKALLEQRGDESSEWSRAWKVCLWARLGDGNRANSILTGYFNEGCHSQLFAGMSDGRVMQIDGTMGVTAGITEMIIQSQQGIIRLLPALPDVWSKGEFNGVCARGAFEINMQWAKKQIIRAEVLSKEGGICRINAGRAVQVTHNGKRIRTKKMNDGSIVFTTLKGNTYLLN
ncbi:MAG: glycoside hydrolase family 95 protein [Chitinophagaceae bacterium]|nr:MAG: glycoside hydrolase family 95 protein [Chitinophagaceae bacterium]